MAFYNFNNITILGTSHIAGESTNAVNKFIEENKPEIIAIELDVNRHYALMHKTKPKKLDVLKSVGLGGFLFYLIGEYIQKKLGDVVNIDPGSEMKAAIKSASKYNLQLVYIDRDIRITLSRFSKYFKKREVLRMIFDLFRKEKVKFDISKVPETELIEKVLEETKKRYPSLYKILIEERDNYMAKKLFRLSSLNPNKKIFAVMGAGHVKGVLEKLKKFNEDKSRVDIVY